MVLSRCHVHISIFFDHFEDIVSLLDKPCENTVLPTSKVEKPEIVLWVKVEVDLKDAVVSDVNRQKRLHTHTQKLLRFIKHYLICHTNSKIQKSTQDVLCIKRLAAMHLSQCSPHIPNSEINIITTFVYKGQERFFCHNLYLYLWQQ